MSKCEFIYARALNAYALWRDAPDLSGYIPQAGAGSVQKGTFFNDLSIPRSSDLEPPSPFEP